ncbi:hypothetical protein SPARM206S_03599 [Streptomyces parvulus]
MDRERGPSVRLKLTLSYTGFLMLAGALMLAAGWLFLTRVPHIGLLFLPEYQLSVARDFAPVAAVTMLFLLVFGLGEGGSSPGASSPR